MPTLELLTTLVEKLPVLVVIYDPRQHAFSFNDAFERLLGWTQEDARAHDLMDLCYPDAAVRAEARAHMSSLAAGWRDLPVTSKRGEVVPVSWANFRLSDERQVGIGIDLRERRAAESRQLEATTEAQRSRAQLETVFAALSEGVLVFDRHGKILLVNDAEARITGFASAAELRRDLAYLLEVFELHELDGTLLATGDWPVCRALRGESFTHREVCGRRKDTGQQWVYSVSGGPIRDVVADETLVVTVTRDITASKRSEAALRELNAQLQETDRRKDEFLGMLSHELRNPLAPIRNSIHLLRHTTDRGAIARAQRILERQTEHLTRLVDDLLDVTRIARGKIPLRPARIDLRELVRHAANDLDPSVEQPGAAIVSTLPDAPVWADVDATRITQIVGNLLHNAAKFTRPGDRIEVSLRTDGREAILTVRDSGAGIDPALLPDVFEPFIQGERTLARTQGGLGLGLALVKGIAELHGGRVRAESEGVGRGAVFTVWLPLADGAPEAPSADAAGVGRASRRVLVVDDNRDAADSLADVIALLGHDVAVAYDGASALARLRGGADARPEVVVCDVGMPGLSGFDVARQARALAGPSVRLVALTGYTQPDEVQRALSAGFDHHLAKPADPTQLARLLS